MTAHVAGIATRPPPSPSVWLDRRATAVRISASPANMPAATRAAKRGLGSTAGIGWTGTSPLCGGAGDIDPPSGSDGENLARALLAERPELSPELRDVVLETLLEALGGGWRSGRRGGRRRGGIHAARGHALRIALRADQLHVAFLALSRPALQTRDQLSLDQTLQRPAQLVHAGEPVQPLGACLQLSGRLRTAQHEHVEHRDLRAVEAECAVARVAVFHRAPVRPARERGPLALHEPVDGSADRVLVVVHDRIAIGGLIAGEPQRVQRERIDVGRGPLLLDQAAEHADLDGIGLHRYRLANHGNHPR